MNPMMADPTNIAKEQVAFLHFPKDEVLVSPELMSERKSRLFQATRLGNLMRNKVRVTFEDATGRKTVETTIWATTEKNVALKGGVVIPIHRILEVRFL